MAREVMDQAQKTEEKHSAGGSPRRGSNQSGMRAYNERLVLSLIRETGALAKAEIARRTGLSAQTVSVIMRSLEADGLLQRGEPLRGKIGQPSIPMSLAKHGAFFLGLKVGRRSLELLLTDFLGEIQHRILVRHPYPTPDNTVEFATNAIDQMLNDLDPAHRARVAGLGIALPFQLWDWAEPLGIPPAEMEGWKNRDIAVELAAKWDFPVFVCNDASTACGAELVFGDQGKPSDFLYFFVGFFIGGGLVLDNTLYTGRTGNAAALGSLMVPTRTGELRQLVDVASLAVLENALAADGRDLIILGDPVSWHLPEEPLENWLSEASQAITHAILASACVIDTGHVYIDGWMPASMRADLVQRIRTHLARMTLAGVDKPDVLEGTIGPDARALGAASLPLSGRFLVERNSFQKGPAS
jgi:predicted NBD/HSP70 family sugar kinase